MLFRSVKRRNELAHHRIHHLSGCGIVGRPLVILVGGIPKGDLGVLGLSGLGHVDQDVYKRQPLAAVYVYRLTPMRLISPYLKKGVLRRLSVAQCPSGHYRVGDGEVRLCGKCGQNGGAYGI